MISDRVADYKEPKKAQVCEAQVEENISFRESFVLLPIFEMLLGTSIKWFELWVGHFNPIMPKGTFVPRYNS